MKVGGFAVIARELFIESTIYKNGKLILISLCSG
jgi:hypothetical protein